jgi:hypothetical protein
MLSVTLCTVRQSVIILSVIVLSDMLSVIIRSVATLHFVIFSVNVHCRHDQNHNAECRHAEYFYARCLYDDRHYDKCLYSDCRGITYERQCFMKLFPACYIQSNPVNADPLFKP